MSLEGKTDAEKLSNLINKNYKDQACWFLNAYWDSFASAEAERIWTWVKKLIQLDIQNKADGSGVDEVNAHRFFESQSETMTVVELREGLRSTGAIGATERPKIVPLTHVLLFKYKDRVNWKTLVNTKGDNTGEIQEAQKLLDHVTAAFVESDKQAQLARTAEEEARKQEAPFKAAQEELEAAIADVKAQEDSYNNKIADLEKKSNEGSVVQQNKAKNELAQLKQEDPLPLRKAKVTLEAARKKAEKARAPFEAATKAAEAARAKAEEALEETRKSVDEAEAYLATVKAKPGTPHGAIWWLERELAEQKSFLPERKGGARRAL